MELSASIFAKSHIKHVIDNKIPGDEYQYNFQDTGLFSMNSMPGLGVQGELAT